MTPHTAPGAAGAATGHGAVSAASAPRAVGASGLPAGWIVGGVLAVASLAAAATYTFRQDVNPVPAAQAPVEAAPAKAMPAPRPADKLQAASPARPAALPPVTARAAPAEPAPQRAACVQCGVVEAVQAVQRKGDGTGLGAVAGGVLGAVVGHQVGGGNGKKAATVLGAVGGGVAGHEVEKRARAETVQQVRVRMDDGSVRTVEQAQAPAVGARVQLQGGTLKTLRSAG